MFLKQEKPKIDDIFAYAFVSEHSKHFFFILRFFFIFSSGGGVDPPPPSLSERVC